MRKLVLMLLASTSLQAAEVNSLHGTVHLQGKLHSDKQIQQCLFVPDKNGDLNIRALVQADTVMFLDKNGKPGARISPSSGTVALWVGIPPLGSVIGIHMQPPYGEKEDALGDAHFVGVNAEGKTLLKLDSANEQSLSLSPSGDYAFAARPGHNGNYGPPTIYRQNETITPDGWPNELHSGHTTFSPDGKLFAVEVEENQTYWTIFLNQDGKKVLEIKERGLPAFSPDSKVVAYVSGDKVQLYSPSGEKQSETNIPGLSMNVIVRFSEDSSLMLIAEKGQGAVRLIDLATKKVRWTRLVSELETIKALGKDHASALQGIDATPSFEIIAVYAYSSGWKERKWGDRIIKDSVPVSGHLALLSKDGKFLDEIAVPQEKVIFDSNYEIKFRIAPNGKRILVGTQKGIFDFKYEPSKK